MFVRTAQPEAIPNMFPANVPLLSRKVAKSPHSSGLFGVMWIRSESVAGLRGLRAHTHYAIES